MTSIDTTAWKRVQDAIWVCERCTDHGRVACDIRQQTEAPVQGVNLLVVGIAPPFKAGIVHIWGQVLKYVV